MKIAVLDTNGVQITRQGVMEYYYVVGDNYDFGGNSATNVTNIDDLKLFHSLVRLNYNEYKDSLKTLYGTLTYGNLSTTEQKILCKNFIVDKTKRDVFFNDEEQKDYALTMQQLVKESTIEENLKGNLDDIINDIDITLVSELSNYQELYIEFDGTNNGIWHTVTINGVSPNSVVIVSIYNKKNTKYGGVREIGSTLDRKRKIKAQSSFSVPVKVDSNNQIEVYRQTADISYNITAQLS